MKEENKKNKDVLEKLQEFCEENNLILSEYAIDNEDIHYPYKWSVKLVKDLPK